MSITLPPNYIPNPRTELGKQALQRYKTAQEAVARVAACGDVERESIDALRNARSEYQSELARGGREGVDVDRETALAQALSAAEHRAAPDAHRTRRAAANKGVQEKSWSYISFVRQNCAALLAGEFEADAIKVHEDVEAARAALAPVEAAYRAQAERTSAFLKVAVSPGRSNHDQAATMGVDTDVDVARRWALPTDGPPLPARHLWDENAAPESAAPAPAALPMRTADGTTVGLTPQAAKKLGLAVF